MAPKEGFGRRGVARSVSAVSTDPRRHGPGGADADDSKQLDPKHVIGGGLMAAAAFVLVMWLIWPHAGPGRYAATLACGEAGESRAVPVVAMSHKEGWRLAEAGNPGCRTVRLVHLIDLDLSLCASGGKGSLGIDWGAVCAAAVEGGLQGLARGAGPRR